MTYAQDRVDTFLNEVHQRHPRVAGDVIERVYDSISLNYTRDTWSAHKRWSKIERRVLVAVLDELVLQSVYARFPGAQTLRTKIGNVRDLLAHQSVSIALGLFDSSFDALRRELYGLSYVVPADHHVHIVNTARAALSLPRDPLVLWDYMLEQLWLSAHDKTGGEAGMAQRLYDALINIFEEEVR